MTFSSFEIFKKKSGTLIPISLNKDIPFRPKRIFLIYGNKGFVRGNHAHKKCSQFLLPVQGKIELSFVDKKNNKMIVLDSKKGKGILLKPLTWCKLSFKTKNAVIMVFCDREYEFNDYIEKYDEFIKMIKNNK
tara:strand:- start:7414 stop:7812 length:399 start_codon:yes stop_codon:yes gene_type:complete